jgi:hypothetical protein
MNERIEKFATECYQAPEFDYKKFAELIVRECLNIAANADMTELEGPDPEDVLYVACKQVKKHFGVEE